MGWLCGGFLILAGIGAILSSMGKRPSRVHDPKGYKDHVQGPVIGCAFMIAGVVVLWFIS